MPPSFRGTPARRSSPQSVRQAPAPRPQAAILWDAATWVQAMQPTLSALGLALSEAQQTLLARYMVMLQHWNSTYNLTALRDAPEMLTHHLADCLTVLSALQRHLSERVAAGGQAPVRLLDVGSGGGLPGVVLAICCDGVQVTCVDTVGKKAAFIRQVAAELRLHNLKAEHARVEQLKQTFDLITSRAFASLVDFVTLTRALRAPGAVWMAMKGRAPEDERAALPSDVAVFHVEQLHVPGLDAERCLVWMRAEQAE